MAFRLTNISSHLISSDKYYNSTANFTFNGVDYSLKPNNSIFLDTNLLTPKISVLIINGILSAEGVAQNELQTLKDIINPPKIENVEKTEEISFSDVSKKEIEEIIELKEEESKEDFKIKRKNNKY